MKSVIYNENTHNVPAKLWVDYDKLDEKSKEQIFNMQRLPFAFHHTAHMPDTHAGYGMPIGCVLATQGVVIPNAVGVDIGCGMCAVKTTLKTDNFDISILKKILGQIRDVIPVGEGNNHKTAQDHMRMPAIPSYCWNDNFYVFQKEHDKALKSLGTLGGGNHFIEIQKDPYKNIWIMIHSGSRNLGYRVAKCYNDIAVDLNAKWHSSVPKSCGLAFLPIDSIEGRDYIREMQYCVDFALANRKLMMDRILDIFRTEFDDNLFSVICHKERDPDSWLINIAHNYAAMENHFGKDVMVHRKGATLARYGTIGIIPGSQGTNSYIVSGSGNYDSFTSCSHGAGRMMSRTVATETLNLEEEIKKMDDLGIVHGLRHVRDLEEAPSAYKNIDEVMQNQSDLVEILVELRPVANIKG